jgi:DNA-binding NtrC family response regulator
VINQPSKILVVDDDNVILETITEYLEEKNFNVLAANNGLDALKMFEAENGGFDLLITDLIMPNIGGVAIISIVKKRYPRVPVIAITGWGEHPETLAKEVEADFVLEKPFTLDELNRIIQNLLSYYGDI